LETSWLPCIFAVSSFYSDQQNLDGKTKGIAGAVASLRLLIGGITGIDFNPPSIEKYTKQINEQTEVVKNLNNGVDLVYWTNAGNKYHLFSDCQHIKNREQHQGTVKDAWEQRHIGENELCLTCQKRAEKNMEMQNMQNAAPKEVPANPATN